MVLNSLPMKLSGVQFAMPILPPGRQTRMSSLAACCLVGREHDAEGRKHDIEAGVGEGKRLRVGFLEGDRQAVGFGTFAPAVEQRADIVRRHDVGEAAGGGERRIAVAGGDVEDALVAAEIDGLAERLADDLQRGADDGVVAGAPGDLLAALDRGEIDRAGMAVWTFIVLVLLAG